MGSGRQLNHWKEVVIIVMVDHCREKVTICDSFIANPHDFSFLFCCFVLFLPHHILRKPDCYMICNKGDKH